MKRFITAMLALALTTALSSEKASAQDRMQPQTQLRDNGYFTGMVGKWHIGYEPAGQVEQYGLLQNDHGQTNSLVPIAGVNRSVPLAGGSENVNSVFDCRPNIVDPPGFKSRVPVAGYDCLGKGVFVTDSGDEEDDPFWDALPPDVYAGER